MKPTTQERIRRAVAASKAFSDAQETSIRLDLALGAPEDLSKYQDCLASARWQGAKAREERP